MAALHEQGIVHRDVKPCRPGPRGSGGTAMAVGVGVLTTAAVSEFGLVTDFGGRAGDGTFHWSRLFDIAGHSAMPAWALSALATSTAVLGAALLIARWVPDLVRPLVAVGSMSLTFYVFQAWMTNVVPETSATTVGVEWLLAVGVFLSFTAFAVVWKTRFRSGPLERVLRVGSGPKRLSPVPVPVPAAGPGPVSSPSSVGVD
ncbi:MAG: DUF418 domain-containing protein [Actinomycetota bacterium]